MSGNVPVSRELFTITTRSQVKLPKTSLGLGLRDQVVEMAQNFPWFALIIIPLGFPLGATGWRRTSDVDLFTLLA